MKKNVAGGVSSGWSSTLYPRSGSRLERTKLRSTLVKHATKGSVYDVIVIGGGNAALCAAISAQEAGGNQAFICVMPREPLA